MEPLFTQEESRRAAENYRKAMERCPARRAQWESYLQSLTLQEQDAMRFAAGGMPLSDLVSLSPEEVGQAVLHSLRVRREVPYAAKVPRGLYRNYVLFYRVNNENIDHHRQAFYGELLPRIRGKSMEQAALEVNLWCYEKATYQASDDRTASPMTVIRRGCGRCGEESVLTVEAMRSVGIPARQCYTPRWAHCDDNHAWVEVWTGDGWHYLGACEPEPALDRGWFTSAASRAMLVHSRAFSHQVQGEEVLEETPVYTTVNHTAAYASCRRFQVLVTWEGGPLAGAQVRFELVNAAELTAIHTAVTGPEGTASLVAGLGSLHLHVSYQGKYRTCLVNLREQAQVCVEMCPAKERGEGVEEFDMIPPAGGLPDTPALSPEEEGRWQARLAQAEAVRMEGQRDWETQASALEKVPHRSPVFAWALACARGNREEIWKFIKNPAMTAAEKEALLSTLREKDLADITADTLTEYLLSAQPYRDCWPEEVYREGLLSPRIGNEEILPRRLAIRSFFAWHGGAPESPLAVAAALRDHVRVLDDYEYGTLVADPLWALRCGVCSSLSLKTLFVAVCRALDFPARLNPVDGAPEYSIRGAFWPLPPEYALGQEGEQAGEAPGETQEKSAVLLLRNGGSRPLHYFQQYSVARLEKGVYQSLSLWGEELRETQRLAVIPGEYRILTAARQIDGSVLARAYYVKAKAGQEAQVTLSLRPDQTREKLLFAELPEVPLSHLGGTGRHFRGQAHVLAFLEPGKEPTEHLLNEFMERREEYRKAGIPVGLAVFSQEASHNAKLRQTLEALPEAALFLCQEKAAVNGLRRALRVGDARLPLAVAVDENGKGLFAFANYNVGTAGTLLDIFHSLQ